METPPVSVVVVNYNGQEHLAECLAALLADFLRGLSPEEIPPAVRLTIGQVFPEWDGRALNVSWKAVMTVMDGLTDVSPSVRDEISAQAVDGGEAGVGRLRAHDAGQRHEAAGHGHAEQQDLAHLRQRRFRKWMNSSSCSCCASGGAPR